jgi:alkylation response protein AidB-like acyl-CoA dehydrogenase
MFRQAGPALSNTYSQDEGLQALLRHHVSASTLAGLEPSLCAMGARAAGELLAVNARFRNDTPEHIAYSPWGERIDHVQVTPAWSIYAQVAAREGLVATAYERSLGPLSRIHQMALVYLFDRSAQVYTCPLAMTDGAARTLEQLAGPELKAEVLPRLISRDPETMWTSGQWMTELTGGSDVGLAQATARQRGSDWFISGRKWFTSAVTSDVALTLARPEGAPAGGKGLALFLVRTKSPGIRVDRLKDKLGTRALPTAELTLADAPATLVAEPRDGVFNMRFMLNVTRTWNSVCAAAAMGRALLLAKDYAARRSAFGGRLADKPLHQETLADMDALHQAGLALAFWAAAALGEEECSVARPAARILLPVIKLTTARFAVSVVTEGMECLGGAGYIEDTGFPELVRDTHVLPIWEGTTNVLSLETLRALRQVGSGVLDIDGAVPLFCWFASASDEARERGARRFALALGHLLALQLLRASRSPAAERFAQAAEVAVRSFR